MDKLRALSIYIETFLPRARQLNDHRYARLWMEAGVPADEAALWANAGYTPAPDSPVWALIADGLGPQAAD